MSNIKNITRKKISNQKLYNLAVEGDESYIANGIVVHNCRSLLIPITMFEDFKPDQKVGKQNINSFIDKEIGRGFSRG